MKQFNVHYKKTVNRPEDKIPWVNDIRKERTIKCEELVMAKDKKDAKRIIREKHKHISNIIIMEHTN